MTKIFIVRHGETNLNKAGIIQCQTDTHTININGVNQAKELANKLKDKNIEFIFSSPYKRAIATAAIIASNINTDIEIENDLREVYGGETLVGTNIKDFQNIKFANPLIFQDFVNKKENIEISNGLDLRNYINSLDIKYANISYPDGETKLQVQTRFLNALNKITTNNPNLKTILLVSHSLTIQSFIMGLTDIKDFKRMNHSDILEFDYKNNELTFINYIKG